MVEMSLLQLKPVELLTSLLRLGMTGVLVNVTSLTMTIQVTLKGSEKMNKNKMGGI